MFVHFSPTLCEPCIAKLTIHILGFSVRLMQYFSKCVTKLEFEFIVVDQSSVKRGAVAGSHLQVCVTISRRRAVRLRWSQHSKLAVAANCSERSLTALYSPSRHSSLAPPSSTVRHDHLRQFGCQPHKSKGRKSRHAYETGGNSADFCANAMTSK